MMEKTNLPAEKGYAAYTLPDGTELEVIFSGKVIKQANETHTDWKRIYRYPGPKPYIQIHGQKYYVDELVASCYCSKLPGHNYVKHKDGDMENCDYRNLEWVTPAEVFGEDVELGEWRAYGSLYVNAEGRVQDSDGCPVPTSDARYEPRLNLLLAVDPYAVSNQCDDPVELMVATLFLPIPKSIDQYGVLHIDGNYKNCAAGNLKWVKKNDAAYKNYLQQKTALLADRTKELNPGKVVPLEW